MSFRKFAKDAFDTARDRYQQHKDQAHQQYNPGQQFPGQQYHNQNVSANPQPQAQPAQGYYSHDEGRHGVGGYDSQAQAAYQQRPVQQILYPAQQAPAPDATYNSPAAVPGQSNAPSIDIFHPLAAGPILIPQCDEHPVPKDCIRSPGAKAQPSQTNAFYGNLLLGGQGCSAWTHPYSLSWAKGQGNARSWGLAISQADREQLAFGPPTPTGASQYYINPVGIQSIIFSAKELGDSSSLSLDSLQAFSANANLSASNGAPPLMTLPLLQGMGFVTALYKGCTPLVQSSVFFRDVQPAGKLNNGATDKYRITLEDGKIWLLYISVSNGLGSVPPFNKVNNTAIEGPPNFSGTVQVAKLPPGCPETFYDQSAGAYATACTISARVYGNQGTYTMTWTKAGSPNPLLMYALHHHISAFTRATAPHVTPMRLQTTTKGMAAGVLADYWQINEQIPIDMGFTPWAPDRKLPTRLSPPVAAAVIDAAKAEVEQDVTGQCNLDSMYFSGKGLGKFAMIAVALHDMAGEQALARRVLDKLKFAFNIFVENRQRTPLVYEKSWRGVVSRAGMENAGADFGNGYYNDHHFHYGYFVYSAAVIGHIEPGWLRMNNNVAWVNMLVRDFANPVNDAEFPFYRSFDWFHGHSWAKGLFESGDGKDEESTSEDAFASYALKMWGMVSGDANLEARGNLMLAVQARVFQTYFLMEKSNTVQPSQILANKVTGITFENKVDHATYFGMNPEYIQGIHMIPLAPCSTLVRTPIFVREEWDMYFNNGRADQVGGGWRGILYANLALLDPRRAWEFFAQRNFDWGWLDGGASKTWYLAWCAALGGA